MNYCFPENATTRGFSMHDNVAQERRECIICIDIHDASGCGETHDFWMYCQQSLVGIREGKQVDVTPWYS